MASVGVRTTGFSTSTSDSAKAHPLSFTIAHPAVLICVSLWSGQSYTCSLPRSEGQEARRGLRLHYEQESWDSETRSWPHESNRPPHVRLREAETEKPAQITEIKGRKTEAVCLGKSLADSRLLIRKRATDHAGLGKESGHITDFLALVISRP